MLGSFANRFRVLMLLLAFTLGMAGQVASTAVMAAQMQPATGYGVSSGHPCPGCPGDHDGGLMVNCSAVSCWTAPALPAQSALSERAQQITFDLLPDFTIAGIAIRPEPHPPRFLFHT